jgi:hypothetical protein
MRKRHHQNTIPSLATIQTMGILASDDRFSHPANLKGGRPHFSTGNPSAALDVAGTGNVARSNGVTLACQVEASLARHLAIN